MSQLQEIIAALPSNATLQESSPKSPSSHSQYQSQIEILKRLPVPYSEIYHVLSSYDTIPIKLLSSKIRKATADLTVWLETGKLAVLGLEMEVKQEDANGKQDVSEIDTIMHRFYPNIEMMLELKDKVGSRLDTPEESQYQQSIGDSETEEPSLTSQELQLAAKTIQSNWTLLKTMLDEVKGIFASSQTRRELLTQMENVLAEIEEIGLGMDRFQEERFHQSSDLGGSGSAQILSSPSLSPSITSLDSNTTNPEEAQEKRRNMEALASLDDRIGSLGTRVEVLTAHIEALSPDDVKHEELQEQYQELLDLWGDTKAHRDRIGDDLKEERWLAVFEQVAGQVESMMESMDRAIVHCKGMVDQIFAMVREKIVPAAPIDRDHLYTTFKSFEAKHKYYAPAVNKMLNMLQNGIVSRATKNAEVIQKHGAMKAKWEELRDSLDRVELDLDGIEEMLDILDASIPSNLPTPPMQLPEKPLFAMRRSQAQAEWISPGPAALFHPPQQSQQPQRGRRPLPSSGSLQSPLYSPKEAPTMTRNRSPINSQPRHRPWSPVPSIPSIASPPSLLSPNTYSNYRSLSPSPSRSPSRAMSDKLRPWCPSTKTTSPSIPGIPYATSTAARYTPRSRSSTRQDRDASPPRYSLTRAASSIGTRSKSCNPSLNGVKPVFSPVGSMSKLSAGALVPRSSSPAPTSTPSTGGGRKLQPKLPPPVVTNASSRFRQLSAPGTPTPQRRSSSPIPTRPKQLEFSLSTAVAPVTRQRQPVAQNARSVSSMGYRSSKSDSAALSSLQGRRRPSLDDYQALQISRTSTAAATTKSGSGSFGERMDSIYGLSGPGTNSGSASSMGLEVCAVPPFEEPTSPSTSSSSSVGSSSRLQPSRFQQMQDQQKQQQKQQQQQQRKSNQLDSVQSVRIREQPLTIETYKATRGDELDEEFARIVNASPIRIQVRRLGEGKYYFGGRMEERAQGKIVAVGGKMGLCRLMEYSRGAGTEGDSGASSGGRHGGFEDTPHQQQQGSRMNPLTSTPRRPEPAASRSVRPRASSYNSALSGPSGAASGKKRKVMVRVGGGWQDLDIFLLDHSSLGSGR